jgi:hypothetical protein
MSKPNDLLAGTKDFIAVLREGALVAVFLLLLLAPGWIKERLRAAGFQKGSIAGMEWEAEIQASSNQAKDAGQAITDIQPKLQEMAEQLAKLADTATDPQAAQAIRDLTSTVEASQRKVSEADAAVKSALVTQQQVLAQAAPAAVQTKGWMYVGKLDHSKTRWEAGSPVTIEPTAAPLTPDRTVKIKDDVYLRDPDAGPGKRASAKIAAVARVGESVKILEVDTSSPDNTPGGGWFVWAKVARLG